MTLLARELLAASGGQSTDGHALIYLDVFTDDGGLADYYAGTMIYEEIFTDGSTRMDVDTGLGMCVFRHKSGDDRYMQPVQLVCKAVYRDRK